MFGNFGLLRHLIGMSSDFCNVVYHLFFRTQISRRKEVVELAFSTGKVFAKFSENGSVRSRVIESRARATVYGEMIVYLNYLIFCIMCVGIMCYFKMFSCSIFLCFFIVVSVELLFASVRYSTCFVAIVVAVFGRSVLLKLLLGKYSFRHQWFFYMSFYWIFSAHFIRIASCASIAVNLFGLQ